MYCARRDSTKRRDKLLLLYSGAAKRRARRIYVCHAACTRAAARADLNTARREPRIRPFFVVGFTDVLLFCLLGLCLL